MVHLTNVEVWVSTFSFSDSTSKYRFQLFFCLKRSKVSIFYVLEQSDECYLPDLNWDCRAGVRKEIRNCRVNQYWVSNVGGSLFKEQSWICTPYVFDLSLYSFHSRHSCYHSCCCLYVILASFPSSYFAIWTKIQLKDHLFSMVLMSDRWALSVEGVPAAWQVRSFGNEHAKCATRLISSQLWMSSIG